MTIQRPCAAFALCVVSVTICLWVSPISAQHGGHGHGGHGHAGHGWSHGHSHHHHHHHQGGNYLHGAYGGYRSYPYSSYGSRIYGSYGLGGVGLTLGFGLGGLYGPSYGYYGSNLYGSNLYGSNLYGSNLYGSLLGGYYPGYYSRYYSRGLYSNGYYGSRAYGATTTYDPIIPNTYFLTDRVPLSGNYLRAARAAFLNGDYANAQRLANHAVIEAPTDSKSHELLSLSYFAQGDYRGAAAPARAAAELAAVADWPTLYRYYNDKSKYTGQLQSLIDFVRENPEAADARFLLAIHRIMLGHQELAKQQFAEYLKLASEDPVAEKLYKELEGGLDTLPKPIVPPPAAPSEVKPDSLKPALPESTE
jgi:hypothetical protein